MRRGFSLHSNVRGLVALVVVGASCAFRAAPAYFSEVAPRRTPTPTTPRRHISNSFPRLRATDVGAVEQYLAEAYPSFASLVALTGDSLWKQLQQAEAGITVFAPNAAAFDALGEKRRSQLWDARNGEAAEKISAYHFVNEPVTKQALFDAGGIVTVGGELPVGQTTSGGLFGFGGKEDGGVKINRATIVDTKEVGTSIVHEVDAFVSPELLWRYCDQLRIPGSQ